jgi:hypothetical protein
VRLLTQRLDLLPSAQIDLCHGLARRAPVPDSGAGGPAPKPGNAGDHWRRLHEAREPDCRVRPAPPAAHEVTFRARLLTPGTPLKIARLRGAKAVNASRSSVGSFSDEAMLTGSNKGRSRGLVLDLHASCCGPYSSWFRGSYTTPFLAEPADDNPRWSLPLVATGEGTVNDRR